MSQIYYRIKELASNKGKNGLLPISSSTIWRLVAQNQFPQPALRLGERVVAWKASDIDEWLAKQTGSCTR
jgi:predicted DNA-binding transcriptional regulator AlpA